MSPTAGLGPALAESVLARLARFDHDDLVGRIWSRDHTLWAPDPTEISNRLGWLEVHREMRERVPELRELAKECHDDGLRTAVLAGMGGSSLAPEVFRDVFGVADTGLHLVVLDTTHPEQIHAVERALDLDRTLFVIASKSGTTNETLSHLAYFWKRARDGSRFVAITDPGTSLADLARERGFRRVFENPPDIGGRYSALSLFGLVPAALLGVDLEALLDGAEEMAAACGPDTRAEENPGVSLGAALGQAAVAGADKLTLVLPEEIRSFGYWIEQLIAESTGKGGKGIVPVEGEDLGSPTVYGDDRLFVALGGAGEEALDALAALGHPVVGTSFEGPADLGAEMFRWELATAVAGCVLGINPFDQPDVQSAKDATKQVLESGATLEVEAGDAAALLEEAAAGDYIAIQAYLPRNEDTQRRLHAVRMRLRDRLGLATTVGFGPRFLHSTGQLHKGGPATGIFLQVVDPPLEDAEIPREPYTFATLLAAQAAGDLQALRERGRRIARLSLAELEAL